jgi:hypothetical protein
MSGYSSNLDEKVTRDGLMKFLLAEYAAGCWLCMPDLALDM